jgi:hypothetical protein
MSPQTQRRLRRLHLYLGVFFAPAIILFSLSGALQTFRWQEEKGYGGTPPAWIVWMASVHKDQTTPRPKRPKPAAAETGAGAGAAGAAAQAEKAEHEEHEHEHAGEAAEVHADAPGGGGASAATAAGMPKGADAGKEAGPGAAARKSTLPLKTFVGLMGLGLLLSAALGIAIALANRGTRRMSLIMLAAGTVLPLALLLL